MDYLRNLGVRTFKRSSLANNAVLRPVFRPDGSLITCKKDDNKLVLNKINAKQNNVITALNESQATIVMKHTEIKGFDSGSRLLD
jgi:hypothetical protein